MHACVHVCVYPRTKYVYSQAAIRKNIQKQHQIEIIKQVEEARLVSACTCMCLYVCAYVYMYICVCAYIYMCVCVCVCAQYLERATDGDQQAGWGSVYLWNGAWKYMCVYAFTRTHIHSCRIYGENGNVYVCTCMNTRAQSLTNTRTYMHAQHAVEMELVCVVCIHERVFLCTCMHTHWHTCTNNNTEHAERNGACCFGDGGKQAGRGRISGNLHAYMKRASRRYDSDQNLIIIFSSWAATRDRCLSFLFVLFYSHTYTLKTPDLEQIVVFRPSCIERCSSNLFGMLHTRTHTHTANIWLWRIFCFQAKLQREMMVQRPPKSFGLKSTGLF